MTNYLLAFDIDSALDKACNDGNYALTFLLILLVSMIAKPRVFRVKYIREMVHGMKLDI